MWIAGDRAEAVRPITPVDEGIAGKQSITFFSGRFDCFFSIRRPLRHTEPPDSGALSIRVVHPLKPTRTDQTAEGTPCCAQANLCALGNFPNRCRELNLAREGYDLAQGLDDCQGRRAGGALPSFLAERCANLVYLGEGS